MTPFDALTVIQTLGQKLGVAEANLAIAQAQIAALQAQLNDKHGTDEEMGG